MGAAVGNGAEAGFMIQSFVFNDGKLVASNLDSDALRIWCAPIRGLLIWVDLFAPTAEETTSILEDVFSFHPLAIEDCLSVSRYPKIEDYEDYLFLVMHAVAFNKEEQFRTTELDFFIGKSFLVTHHSEPLSTVTSTIERIQKNPVAITRGMDRLAHFLLDTMVDAYQPVLNDLTRKSGAGRHRLSLPTKRADRHPRFSRAQKGAFRPAADRPPRSAMW
jgi:magnesium transporter